ncbi:uncharacterized protein LOC143362173 [Halictus rubicundus]|uniref:uncharacterized protein LOC143362173 n=1 Tax=Halictus rubicundus TaxID=77578 RepID=UPI004035AE47
MKQKRGTINFLDSMATSASFYRNVSLLTELVPPSEEFKQHFREGMFDKPNTAGFLHTSHYLLTIYDSKRFKKLFEWPVTCKKTEAIYRNNVKTFLTVISTENRDIEFPNILVSHLFHASGSKFTIIMWKLSQVVLRKYIVSTSSYDVMFIPQMGIEANVGKKFLKKTYAKVCCSIFDRHRALSEMEEAAETFLKKEEQKLNNIKTEIFESEQVIKTITNDAPVYSTIKKRLVDINDKDVIQMWKTTIRKCLYYLQNKNSILKNVKELSQRVNDIVSSISSDIQTLDANQYQRINYLEMSELFPYNMQTHLLQLYANEKLNLHNFILLFESILIQLYQRLKLNSLEDLSVCRLQTESSCKDITEALNICQMHLSDIKTLISETRQKLYHILQKNNIVQIYNDLEVSTTNNVLLMSTPTIKIDTSCTDIEFDLQNRLVLTPVGAVYKSLFSRYEHLKPNNSAPRSKFRENLFASHINFDDSISTINDDTPSLHALPVSSKKNLLSSKQAEKYSRLFSTRTKRNNTTAISNVISVPSCTNTKANSTAIANTIEGVNDILELGQNMSEKTMFDKSIEFTTPIKLTIAKDDEPEDASEVKDVVNMLQKTSNVLNLCETITTEMTSNETERITKTQRRRSISDLVERYKKLLDRV